MCLILFSWKSHPDYPLIVAANRDEFYKRPSLPIHFWEEAPHLLAGQDLEAKGTWLGISRRGRFAALTNFRDPAEFDRKAHSRGALVADFLKGTMSPKEYLKKVHTEREKYNGFNLLVSDFKDFFHYANREGIMNSLPSGIYGLSNHLLDTPWPKVEKGKELLQSKVENNDVHHDSLRAILENTHTPPDKELPDTGIGLAWERKLGSIFIAGDDYGTCCSTVLGVNQQLEVTISEHLYYPDLPAQKAKEKVYRFEIDLHHKDSKELFHRH